MNLHETIVNLWHEDFSASEIATQVGKTKNSVMGIIHRLRAKGVFIANRESPIKTTKEKTVRARRLRPLPLLAWANEDPMPEEKTLFELDYDDCRYITGRSRRGALYCAEPTHRRQMCKAHYKLCYVRIKSS